jgi:hypothetical protein
MVKRPFDLYLAFLLEALSPACDSGMPWEFLPCNSYFTPLWGKTCGKLVGAAGLDSQISTRRRRAAPNILLMYF